MSSSPIFDPDAIDRLCATLGDEAGLMLPALVDEYLAELPDLVAQAADALDRNAVADLRRIAHNLKSSSLTFGALALAEAARSLEYAAKEDDLASASALLAALRAELDPAYSALTDASEVWS